MFVARTLLAPAVALMLATAPWPAGTPLLAAAPKTAALVPAVVPGSTVHVLPWIDDDYTRAMAEAKARKIPLFVESWAPW